MPTGLPRPLHPAAWWAWAVGLAVAAGTTTNPLLLLLTLAVAALVVAARRGSTPWARAFRLYLWLGLFIVLVRVVLHVLVGLKVGTVTVLPLPEVQLPEWAAGVQLLGDVKLEGLLAAAVEGLRLAVVVACVGAANALANPKRLLRALPGALAEVGAAVVVSVTVAPQLAESVQRVLRARALRGDTSRGLRALPRVALPVLEDTLERSLLLAGAMDSRGYGRRPAPSTSRRAASGRAATGALVLAGLVATALGLYGVLDGSAPALLGLPVLLAGVTAALVGVWLRGRGAVRTAYRPDPWAAPEWLTAVTGAGAAAALLWTSRTTPDALGLPLDPVGWPALPVVPVVGLLVAALPAVLTPPVPRPASRTPRRGAAPARVEALRA
ncbi:MAG TPA: CbiQ family ECF transporter T component [Dermatophilaceae bacterium]|nr:CbiQ family ECF transporter T component [Dermatophilaceae bacterium]